MISCRTSITMFILCLFVLGALAGNYVYSLPTVHPDHECTWDRNCQKVYAPNHPTCVNANFPHCVSQDTPMFWKCIPKPNVQCSEDPDWFGATICSGACSVWNPVFQVWVQEAPLRLCSYTLEHCK